MTAGRELQIFVDLTKAIARTRTVEEISTIALDTLTSALHLSRAAILLFDADGVMRFTASRGLSDAYRAAVEGHSPWRKGTPDAEPIVVADVHDDPSLAEYVPLFEAERIAALVFMPLSSGGGVIGKFMLYYDAPHAADALELQVADIIGSQVAFAVERTRAEAAARRSEARLRFALDAAQMGTWEWDLRNNTVEWSDNLEALHGLPRGVFEGSFDAYAREIHADDRDRVYGSVQRALRDGTPHDVEYRLVAPDGTVRWCEGKGRVEYESGTPVRMTGVCMMATRRKEAELARLAAAEEAGRLKDEFLATLSHEMRTPLNAILGWVQMLESARLTPERTRYAIEVIARNARLQAQLIEDILDVSRIITGKLVIDRVPVDVSGVLLAVARTLAPSAAARGVALETDVDAGTALVEGDAGRLQQVLNNVVSNAVKFTDAGGQIAISCRQRDAEVVIEVRDTGAGIGPEFLPYVFDRFRQADSGVTRRHGGLGLGLAIARHLVTLHGGHIRAGSEGAGLGTTITIRLPAFVPADGPAAEVAPTHGASHILDGVTVLVVDDDPDSREVVAEMLSAQGAQVVQADGGFAAMAVLEGTPIQLLLADIAMPEMDGYALIREVRRLHPAITAIAVSAYARPQDSAAAIDAGFDAYCAKPVELSLLVHIVTSLTMKTSAS